MYSDELSDVIRTALQPMSRFQQHCDAADFTDKGYGKGELFTWNIYSDLATQGGKLQETQKMPESNFTITQGTGTIYEFGNSVPYSGLLDDLSKQPVKQIIHKALKNDANKAFEAEAYAQFAATPLVVSPTSGNSTTAIDFQTDGTAGTAASIKMSNVHVKLIADEMKERNIPVYADGSYRCIGKPSAFRDLKDDLESLHSYVSEGFSMILNGEVGRSYEGIRFFEQTTVNTSDCFFFGEDTVIEAIVCPPEIRGKVPTDFGRDKGIAWYALEGFALVHTAAATARIVRWDQA
jgi:hypothetical protein